MRLEDRRNRPLGDLRISVIDQCNFRCGYCMPAEVFGNSYRFLGEKELLSFDEIVRLARIFAGLGVEKIKLTGGEPLLRLWLPELIRELKSIPALREVALITNGYYLASMAPRLRAAGLDRITVSLDSLDSENFKRLNGRGYDIGRVLEGMEAALDEGFRPLKINMVVMRGKNDHEIMTMVDRFASADYILRFIEYMDVGNRNRWRPSEVFSAHEIQRIIGRRYTLVPLESNYPGEVARRLRILERPGELGFISSVSSPFCGGCTRARLSADGKLFTCLFSRAGYDLKTALREGGEEFGDERAREMIRSVWRQRSDAYSEERGPARAAETAAAAAAEADEKVEMYYIGG